MEEGKRKYLCEPVQQQGTSKYGRKVSKFVFKIVKNNSSVLSKEKVPLSSLPAIKHIIKSEKQEELNISDSEVIMPSIVLCGSNSTRGESVLEHHLDISPHSVIKKIKINPPCKAATPLRTKEKFSYKTKGNNKLKYLDTNLLYFSSTNESQKCKIIADERKPVPNVEVKFESVSPVVEDKGKGKKKRSRSALEQNEDKLVEEKINAEELRLRAEYEKLKKLFADLTAKAEKVSEIQSYQKERLSLSKLRQNQEMLYYYSGFKDLPLLDSIVLRLSEYFSEKEKASELLLVEDQLIMTLMKLRRNYSMHDLAFRFRVSVSEADCIVFNVIVALHHLYFEEDLKAKPFPSIFSQMPLLPEQFRSFPNCKVILECVKISCEDPDNESETEVFTSAKFDPKISLKGLLGISPLKYVLFASSLYEESTSNADIFKDSGILEKLVSGDLVMADKSYEIRDCLPPDIELNVPVERNSDLSEKQIRNLNSKARAFIGRTSMQHLRRFTILNHIPIFLNSIAMKVFQLCATLVNLQQSISKNDSGE